MNTMQNFKKAWGLVWRYRATWLFGFLLALTVGSTPFMYGFPWNDKRIPVENRVILSRFSTIRFPGEGLTIDFSHPGAPFVRIEAVEPGWYRDSISPADFSDVWVLLISIGIVVLICAALAILFRYTSQAALIRMVDEKERSEAMVGVRRGLRLGWSRVAGKLFLIDLCINLPLILIFCALFFLATSPLWLLGLGSTSESLLSVLGISLLTMVGLSLVGFLIIIAVILLSITRPVMHQACAVDGLGVGASIRQGFHLLRTRFSQVMVTWLVWIGVRLAWSVASIPAVIILLPILLLTIGLGAAIGAIPTLLVAGIAHLFVNPVVAWIIGIVCGVPLFFIIAFSPITFLSGLVEVFKSSFWTLSYREFRPLPVVMPQSADKSEGVELNAPPA
jgi:hypothetical protein